MARISRLTVNDIKKREEKRRGRQALAIVVALLVTGLCDPVAAQKDGFRSVLDRQSLTGWIVENAAETHAQVLDGVLAVSGDPGWIRTESTEFGTFVLQFDARVSKPDARAMVALFGRTDQRRVNQYAFTIPLFGQWSSETFALLRRRRNPVR